MLFPWSRKQGKNPTNTTDEDDVDEVVDLTISKKYTLWLPFFLESAELSDALQMISCHPDSFQI